MKKYEILLVLPGTFSDTEAEAKNQEVVDLLKNYGEDISFSIMTKNRLSYPINNIRYGYFSTVSFNSEPEKMEPLRVKLSLIKDLLRASIMLVGKDAKDSSKISYFTENRPSFTSSMKSKNHYKPNNSHDSTSKVEDKTGIKLKEEVKIDEEQNDKKKIFNEEKPEKPDINLKDIDKKLDEILSDDNIVSGI